MRRLPSSFSAVFLACLCTLTLAAQTTIHVPADQPTIQAGIKAAHDGDTVSVAPGTYHENINFLGKSITLQPSGAAGSAIIDGSGGTAVVTIAGPFASVPLLYNFAIQNGGLPANGLQGAIVITQANPYVVNNQITGALCNGISSVNSLSQLIITTFIYTHVVPGCLQQEGLGSAIAVNGVQTSANNAGNLPRGRHRGLRGWRRAGQLHLAGMGVHFAADTGCEFNGHRGSAD